MLESDHRIFSNPDPIFSLICAVNGRRDTQVELRPGIYEIGHHGGSDWPPGSLGPKHAESQWHKPSSAWLRSTEPPA